MARARGLRGRGTRGAHAALGPALALAALLGLVPRAAQADLCSSPARNPTIAENCDSDPQSISQDWMVDRARYTYDPSILAGYASRASVAAGDTLHFYVQAPPKPATYSIAIYRLGWYRGRGGRLLQTVAGLSAPPQPPCAWRNEGSVDAYYTCRSWSSSYQLRVPPDWTSGIYVAVLVSSATAPPPQPAGLPYMHHVPFVVREDHRRADFLYQQSIVTEQAYNSHFYGPSLYNTQSLQGHAVPIAKATFDRPYDAFDNLQIYRFELPFVAWLEASGYDVSYATDVDLHERERPLAHQHKALLVAGHPEYWSRPMLEAVQAARDAGVHLGFFGGNALYWQMRLEDEAGPAGDATHRARDRVVAVYRHPYPPNSELLGDPNPAAALQTVYWRDFPLMRDEESLVGVHFTHPQNCRQHVAAWATSGRRPTASAAQRGPVLNAEPQPLVVRNASSWVYAGTGLTDGASIPHVYGQEADSAEADEPSTACGTSPADPPPRRPNHRAGTYQLLSSSPFLHMPLAASGTPTGVPTVANVNSTIYQACGGGWVFGAGSIMWGNALGRSLILGADYSNALIQRITANVLDVYAGRATPAVEAGRCEATDSVASIPAALLLLDE